MKKTNKMIWLAALALTATAGLVACGGGEDTSGGDTPTSSKAPTSSKHTHKYGEAEIVKPATCSEEGEKKQTCADCGDVKTSKISKAAHSWIDVAEGSHAATCTEGGVQNQKCSVCEATQAVESEALGHDWGNTVWESQATCDDAGVGSQSCSRCDATNPQTQEALGHNYVTNDTAEPEPGYAAVRVYQCENGCEKSALGFKANEVTEESKSHLTIGTDGGAAFWGRPIGNNLELDENGTSVNQTADELVFDETQTGDFFEYKFKLTAAQVAQLGASQKLYCDAKPAGYMGQNNVDFWAYGANSSDWTPGAYIEGEHKGEIISDFRYVLYVDGERQDLDATVKTPVGRNDPRKEYVLPYTFKLHEGENTIRLVMSGGYRSTFYNFTFRSEEGAVTPDNPSTPDTPDTPATKSYAVTGANIVAEGGKSYVEVSGTMEGYTAADKFAFGLVSREASGADSVAGNWIVGSEEPADADYKYSPTITGNNWSIKLDISEVAFTGGVYSIVVGPKGSYTTVSLTSGIGNGDAKVNGYRIYMRSDLGAIAADKLPPIALTESYLAVEDGKIYHYIGGALSISEAEFLAKDPYLNYEQCVNWRANKLNSSLISTVVKDGKGYVKVDVSALGVERYNVKLNLDAKADVDTQMETIIDTSSAKVEYDGKLYSILADKTHAGDKAYIYGNLGLIVEKAPKPVSVFTAGKLRIEAENYDTLSNNGSVTKIADETASGGYYLEGLNSYNESTSYDFTLAEEVTVTISIRYSFIKAGNESYGPMEFYIDGAEIDQANRGSTTLNDWQIREIPAQTLAAGAHTIKVQSPYSNATNFDYFELSIVAA